MHQDPGQLLKGILLVVGAAVAWSIGGTIDRFITLDDTWTIVFWRSTFAALFLLAFMVLRDGASRTLGLLKAMGWPGLIVSLCFAISSTAFVTALSLTTVAKILLIQSSVPVIAAGLSWLILRERIPGYTFVAMAVVIAGIAIIVSGSVLGPVSLLGDALSILIAFSFSLSVVVTRKYPSIRMTPAVFVGAVMAACFAALMAGSLAVSGANLGWLVVFGTVNLGLGLALFVTGARLIPSVLSALLSNVEPILGPIWVWWIHNEVPTNQTLIGGTIVVLALVANSAMDWHTNRKPKGPLGGANASISV